MVSLRRARRPERQMAAYQRHLLRMKRHGASADDAAADAEGALGGLEMPQPPAIVRRSSHPRFVQARVVTRWTNPPAPPGVFSRVVSKPRRSIVPAVEKRTSERKALSKSAKKKDSKTEKNPRKQGDEPADGTYSAATKKKQSKWRQVANAVALWRHDPPAEEQLETVSVAGGDDTVISVQLRKPPRLQLAYQGLLETDIDIFSPPGDWQHPAAVFTPDEAVLNTDDDAGKVAAYLLASVVQEEAAAMLQDEITDVLAQMLVQRVVQRAQLLVHRQECGDEDHEIVTQMFGGASSEKPDKAG